MEAIKVGFCVAYDWHFLQHTLPLVYEGATDICLAIDRNRISWSGNPYSFDEEAFRQCIANIDSNKKIRIYEDGFYLPNLTPMQNEVRERNMIAQFFGEGGWHIQLDCDEHFVGFGNFAVYLRSINFMDDNFGLPKADLDIIFCRNVLIYFDKATQERVIRKFCAHLKPGGILFLGHSESIIGMDLPLIQVRPTIYKLAE